MTYEVFAPPSLSLSFGSSNLFWRLQRGGKKKKEKVFSYFSASSLDLVDTLLKAMYLFCPLVQVSENMELREDTGKLLKSEVTSGL